MKEIKLSEIPGFNIGHAEDLQGATGCTVVFRQEGGFAGVDVRGGAPGTRETDLLRPENMVEKIHAVCLAGGSAFGLDASSGAARFLEENNAGFDVGVAKVPIVCSAVLFDLTVGDPYCRPNAEMGYRACLNKGKNVDGMGNVGAGAGASVGKITGMERAVKGGLGSFAYEVDGLYVGAVVAVNCLGDVIDPDTGRTVAGLLTEDGKGFAGTEKVMPEILKPGADLFRGNTTIGIVLTNAAHDKGGMTKLASMAHDGYARSMRPAHSMVDGDTIFTYSSGEKESDLSLTGMLAAKAVEKAVVRAVVNAESLGGVFSVRDLGLLPV